MFKKLKIGLVTAVIVLFGTQGIVLAQQGTVIPKAPEAKPGTDVCTQPLNDFSNSADSGAYMKGLVSDQKSALLGCAVVTGRVSLAMLPYFIQYISNYLLGMISLVALLFTVIGGVLYSAGGLTEKKDQGKAYIKNALFGMGTAFLAWTVVNVIISAITG